MTEPRFLTLAEVLQLHAYQVENFGGEEGPIKMALPESALAMPRQTFGGQYLHPDLASMAAAYLFHIVSDHAFHDGNKRTGVHAAVVFLAMNGAEVELPTDETEAITVAVADKKRASKEDVVKFFTDLLAKSDCAGDLELGG